jgi:methylthioribose-1-phosphate isomerase
MSTIEAVGWSASGDALRIIDQTRLPGALVELTLQTVPEIVEAIRALRVRGAPAIGVAGAIGLAVVAEAAALVAPAGFDAQVQDAIEAIRHARPTAVNLSWAVDRVARAGAGTDAPMARATRMRAEADAILSEDRAMCAAIGEHGAGLLRDGMRVLTHCNAGALATAGIGTALAPIYTAHRRGVALHVYADETRPLLQGARLTAWELMQAGVPVTLITDNMAGALMREGRVDAVLVGADRIAANGDAANKIGTYGVAVLARAHNIPFYVLAPWSTVDVHAPSGATIEIEQRAPDEVRTFHGMPSAPALVPTWNPAFDVTPAALITAIVTDRGVHHPPFTFR